MRCLRLRGCERAAAGLQRTAKRHSAANRPFQSGRPAGARGPSARVPACQATFKDAPIQPTLSEGKPTGLPTTSGVYAVYNPAGELQYIGISRNIGVSVNAHMRALGPEVHSVKVGLVEDATRDSLTAEWKAWVEAAVQELGSAPPGNVGAAKERWQMKRSAPVSSEIKLTAGKGADDVTCEIKDLIKMVVDNEPVVAFVKGTKTQPECGFSYQMMKTLNSLQVGYKVVNVLDEQFNPGVRDAIKEFSAWPTIPQLYVKGEFVGGSDIVQEMFEKGELSKMFASEKQ